MLCHAFESQRGLKQSYLSLKEDADRSKSYNGKNLASHIKSIEQQHGFEYVWQLQSDIEIPFESIKLRILDTYKQKWYSDINNSSRLRSYCLFKHTFEFENYLDCIPDNNYKIALSRFRTSSHSLTNIELNPVDMMVQQGKKDSVNPVK